MFLELVYVLESKVVVSNLGCELSFSDSGPPF